MEHRKSEFIPGIEGLRAIAILAVLINHLDSNFMPGGYLGVDLFFVISGFVVSRSLDIVSNISLKNYLVEFYSKRLKRLFPALLISFILISLVGTFLFEGFGITTIRTGGASLLGLSNLYLIHINTDYFGLGSEYNLFLPTWSLGIEEQFYFFFPLFLFWLKFKNKNVSKWLIPVMILSFATFTAFHFLSKNYQYYFPLSRLWELLGGAFLYFFTKNKYGYFKRPFVIHVLLFMLVIMFFLPAFTGIFSTYTYFTFAAPVVCLISAGLIYSSVSINSRALTNPVMMYLGKISYSIYLYHFAVLKIFNPGSNWLMLLLSMVVVLAVSIGSFKFIETPIRNKKWNNKSGKKLLLFTASTAALSILIFYATRKMTEKDPFMRPTKAEYRIDQCDYFAMDNMDCRLSSKGNANLYFIGDSHSNALVPVMLKFHDNDNFGITSISTGGLTTTTMTGLTRKVLNQTSSKGLDFILKNLKSGDTVIMTNQLMTWFSHTLNDDPEQHRLTFDGKVISHEEGLQRYIGEKKELARLLKSKNVKLIITAPFPDFPLHPSKCYSPVKIALGWQFSDGRCETLRSDQDDRRKVIVAALKKLEMEESNVKIFDPIDLICDESVCKSYKAGRPVYYDDDHINFNLAPELYNKLSTLLK